MIGIVGVGDMGLPMAGHMVAGGLDVLACDVDPDRLAAAEAAGATIASGLAQVADEADVVVACLRTDDQMQSVAEELVARDGTGRLGAGQLIVVEPADQRGRTWPLVDEMTLGRAAGCHVAIPEDTFASQIHARIFSRDGQTWVEDLGSTNGTYVNRAKVSAATAVRRGDLVQIGNTVMELG